MTAQHALPIDPTRLVFVGGLHRSGTTPLTRVLGAHPSISAFHDTGVVEDEGQHLQSVYPPARAYGGAGRFAFDERAHLTEESPLCSPESAARLLTEWSRHWDTDRPVLVEKSPPNLVMTRYLAAAFPGSRMVVCVRHPIVVALATAKWTGPVTRLGRLLEHWIRAHEIFRSDAQYLDSIHVVRYEHLVRDPQPTLAALAAYLDLDTEISAELVDARRSDAYVDQWARLHDSRLGRLTGSFHRLRDRYAEALADFGYDFDDLTFVAEEPIVASSRGVDGR
jgi:hypothetical protein